ncbi:hypothetical protein HBI13_234910 [Parastagonospora nodorum]|nr:hypothetical protein HBI10_021160 [Parastagonospora nodorum]KAH4008518.1 hypothetical protein HBI13_234910 [Parastagonospora nodorum]KAH5756349.1 hypothetical protein HBI17_076680 [Parastagonospora nodorum]
MSGIEIAGLVFGIVPIVVKILKSYGTAKRRLITFSRHVEVADDIQTRFDVASAHFNNDCRLLLQATIADPDEVPEIEEMMNNPTHKSWQKQGKRIDERLKEIMEQDYELCGKIVTRLHDILCETQNSLTRLQDSLGKGKRSQREYVEKICDAFTISRKENGYIRQLESLNIWNNSLSKLLEQRCRIRKRCKVPSAWIIRKAVPKRYQQIRLASQQLGESIHDSWSCTNTSHSGHQAKLSLDAESEHDNVQLDVVVACQTKPDRAIQGPSTDVPIWLQIRSITSLTIYRAPTSPPPPVLAKAFRRGLCNISQVTTHTSSSKAKSTKRVRIDDPKDEVRSLQAPATRSTETTQAESFLMLDLKTTESVCCHVTSVYSSTSACQDGCVGFLEVAKSRPAMRFMFYDASKLAVNDVSSCTRRQGARPIKNLIKSFNPLQQMTLAHKLAEAVLQYHSSSWLPQAWTLQDVAYFTDTSQPNACDISDALSSLHLSKRFPKNTSCHIDSKQELLDLKHKVGVRNLTLAKLGVALLEICTKDDIMGTQLDGTHGEIIKARGLLDEKHHSIQDFGLRYLEIVRKCLYCDFSCDDDLQSDALQSAIYTEVVCALQDRKTQCEKWFSM